MDMLLRVVEIVKVDKKDKYHIKVSERDGHVKVFYQIIRASEEFGVDL